MVLFARENLLPKDRNFGRAAHERQAFPSQGLCVQRLGKLRCEQTNHGKRNGTADPLIAFRVRQLVHIYYIYQPPQPS
jgi:hypothetical protein